MKTLLVTLLTMFAGTVLYAQTIEQTYYFDKPLITQTGEFDLVTFENTLNTGLTGEPALPYQAVKLLLPPGYEAAKIDIISKSEQKLNGQFHLYPAQASRPLSEGKSNEFKYNAALYSQNTKYPSNQLGSLSTEYMNGHSIALCTFTPLSYNPAKREVSYSSEITVKIDLKKSSEAEAALKNLKKSATINNTLKNYCQNPEILKLYPETKDRDEDDYEMVIITAEDFEDDFEDIIELYKPRGIEIEIVTVEYINNNMTGLDSPEKIRNYIIQEYQDHGVEYILLGGDVEHVPYRGFYCYVESGSGYESNNIPADLYYSALDGNWNDDGDDSWGEIGEDDLLPDVSVARYSFSNSSELEKMINKTLSYQDDPVLGEMDQPLLAGEHLWSDPVSWGADYLDLLIGYQNENGYETTGIPVTDNYDTLYDRSGTTWNKNDLLNDINSGASFVHHSGHSNATYTMRLGMSDITNANFSGTNGIDHNFTLVYTHGCICGAFDESDCIAEKMAYIDNFLVAGAFNSRYGWFNEGQTEGPSAHIHREFVDALYDQKKNKIGETHKISKIETSPWVNAPGQHEEGALRWCFYDCNILGDPATAIWTAEPLDIYTVYPSAIHIGDGSFDVNVTENGTPLENMICVFMQDGEIISKDTTGEYGNATISYDPSLVSIGEADLKVSGYNCLPHSYNMEIIPDEGPYVLYESDTINDQNGNNNGVIDYTENILLTIDMNNAGLEDATNVDVKIRSNDMYINLTDTTENYGNIPAGQTVSIEDGFNFEVADSIPDQHIISIEVIAEGEETWISEFEILLSAPILEIGNVMIDDSENGNNNGMLDPGETADLLYEVSNSGHSNCIENTTGLLSSDNTFVEILNDEVIIENFESGQTETIIFTVSIDEAAPVGETAIFNCEVSSAPYTTEKDAALNIGLVTEDFETGDFTKFNWESGGNEDWIIISDNPFEGTFSARSGTIGNSSTSELLITMDVMLDGEISFVKKVSSEEDYDYLRFYIDNDLQDEWAGEEEWSEVSYNVSSGEHTFKWSYEKDVYVSGGSDCAWLDNIIFPPVSLISGIEISSVANTSLWPNPCQGNINLDYNVEKSGKLDIQIMSIDRKIILQQTTDLLQGNNSINIKLDNIENGIYILNLIEGNTQFKKKIVVAK